MSSAKRGARTSARSRAALATAVRCDDERLHVTLSDGRVISAPLPERVRHATPEQRRRCRVEGFGIAVTWDDLDEDLGVHTLLGVTEGEVFALVER